MTVLFLQTDSSGCIYMRGNKLLFCTVSLVICTNTLTSVLYCFSSYEYMYKYLPLFCTFCLVVNICTNTYLCFVLFLWLWIYVQIHLPLFFVLVFCFCTVPLVVNICTNTFTSVLYCFSGCEYMYKNTYFCFVLFLWLWIYLQIHLLCFLFLFFVFVPFLWLWIYVQIHLSMFCTVSLVINMCTSILYCFSGCIYMRALTSVCTK